MTDLMADLTALMEEMKTVYKKLCFAVAPSLVLLFFSCGNKGLSIVETPSETICELQVDGQEGMLGRLNSIAVVNEDCFAVCDEGQVYLYDGKGRQLRKIGRSGNAGYEYNMPLIVRSDGTAVYVWSAMTMEFIVYGLDGNPKGEYKYNSAIRDFVPAGESIVIYPAGVSGGSVIEIYDTKTESVIRSLGETSASHEVLLHWMSVAPVTYCNGSVFYMSQDKLEVNEYKVTDGSQRIVGSVDSDSFHVGHVKSGVWSDRVARQSYLHSNPFTVMLVCGSGMFYILASEGEYVQEGRTLSDEKRYCSVYRLKGDKGKKIVSFTMDSFGYTNLLTSYHGDIYFIHHEIRNDEDVYTLKKLILR